MFPAINHQINDNPFDIDFNIDGEMPNFPKFDLPPASSPDGQVYALTGSIPEVPRTLAMGYEELDDLAVFIDYENVTVDTGTIRPGGSARSLRVNPSADVAFCTWAQPGPDGYNTNALYPSWPFGVFDACSVRAGIYVDSLPSTDQVICQFNCGSGGDYFIKITNGGYFKFYGGTDLLATSSDFIDEDEWNLLEFFVRLVADDLEEATSSVGLKINGTLQFIDFHIPYAVTVEYFTFGSLADSNTYDIYWDDIKIISTGFSQLFVGDGNIVYRHADGLTTSDYIYFNDVDSTNVDEIPSDDDTTSDIAADPYPGTNPWGQLYPIEYVSSIYFAQTVSPCIRLREHVEMGMLGFKDSEISIQTVAENEAVFALHFTDTEGEDGHNYAHEMKPTVDFAWRLKHLDKNSQDTSWNIENLTNLQVGVYKDNDDAPYADESNNAEITTVGVLIDYGTEENTAITQDRETLAMGYEELSANDVFLASGGDFSIDSGTVHSGGSRFSLRLNPSADVAYTTWAGISRYIASIDADTSIDNARPVVDFGFDFISVQGVDYHARNLAIRFYLYVASFPSVDTNLFTVNGDVSDLIVKITSGGLLKLYDDVTLIGTSSTAITSSVWTKIEAILQIEDGINSIKIGSTEEISGAGSNSNTNLNSVTFGCETGTNTYDVFLDDIKIARAKTPYQEYFGLDVQYIGSGSIVYCPANGLTSSIADGFNPTNSNNVDELPPSDDITTNDSYVYVAEGIRGEQLYPIDTSFFDDIVVGRFNTVMWTVRPKDDVATDNHSYFLTKADGLPAFGDFLQTAMRIDTNWYWRLDILDRLFNEDYEIADWTRDQVDTVESGFGTGLASDTYRITTAGALVDYSIFEPEGGLIIGGETEPTLTFNHTPSGGLVLSGETEQVVHLVYVGTGGITFGGAIDTEYVIEDGGLTFGTPLHFTQYITLQQPLVWWRFHEVVGSVTAINSGTSGSVLNGTYVGSVIQSPSLITDEPSNFSRFFNGINNSIFVPNSTELNLGLSYSARTILVWFRPFEDQRRQVIYEEGDAARGINIYILNGFVYGTAWNMVYEGVGTHTPWSLVSVVYPIVSDGTYNLALVLNSVARTFSVYINGVLINTVSNIGILGTHPKPSIGCKFQGTRYHDSAPSGTGDYYHGSVDELIIYSAALPAADVALNYLYSTPMYFYTTNFEYTGSGGFTFAGTSPSRVLYSYDGSGGVSFGGSAEIGFEYVGSGGLTFGGVVDDPVFNVQVFPSGGLVAGGEVLVYVELSYEGSGGITFGGTSIEIPNPTHAYTGSGGLTFGGVIDTPTITYKILKNFSWNILEELTILKTFAWNIARSVYRQYLVQYACGETDSCGNENVVCGGASYSPNLTIFARSLDDVRDKLLDLDLDRGIDKIYVYSNPLFESDFSETDSKKCNPLIDITPSITDEGWESLLEYGVFVASSKSKMVVSSVIVDEESENCGTCGWVAGFNDLGGPDEDNLEWNLFIGQENCADGCECVYPDVNPSYNLDLYTTNCAPILTLSIGENDYVASGIVRFGGSADVLFPDYYGTFVANSKSSSIVADQDVEYAYDPIDSGTIDVSGITTLCNDNPIPAKIYVVHNLLEASLKFRQFLIRNNKTVDEAVPIYYSKATKTWNNTLDFTGYSSVNNQQEVWNLIFEFGCVSENLQSLWKFESVLKRKVIGGRNSDVARVVLYFNSDVDGLNESSLDLDIIFNVETMSITPSTEIEPVFYDDGSFFVGRTFLNNPLLTFGIKNIIITSSSLTFRVDV